MSRVVTNRGRQRFRVAVNGESLSDDLKKTARVGTQESVKKYSQGRNPRIREEKSSANSRQRRESVMAVRRLECGTKLQSAETQFW